MLLFTTKVRLGLVPPRNMRRTFVHFVMPLERIFSIKQTTALVTLELDLVFSVCGPSMASHIALFCKRLVANITPTRLVGFFLSSAMRRFSSRARASCALATFAAQMELGFR